MGDAPRDLPALGRKTSVPQDKHLAHESRNRRHGGQAPPGVGLVRSQKLWQGRHCMTQHPKTLARLEGKLAVVTGASDGIGVETARYLAAQGASLVLPVRNMDKGKAARDDIAKSTGNDKIEVAAMDLASLKSVRAFAQGFCTDYLTLDVLVLNAGISPTRRVLTEDGFESTWGINHFGHFVLAHALMAPLRAAGHARIAVVSSKLHTAGTIPWDDLTYTRTPTFGIMKGPYPDSKLANVLFAYELAERLAGTGITVNALHPGVVNTSLSRDMNGLIRAVGKWFFTTPEKGSWTSVYVAASPEVEGVTGRYFDACKACPSSATSQDAALRKRLWKHTEDLTGSVWTPPAVATV